MSQSEQYWNKIAKRYAAGQISDQATYDRKLKETQTYLRPSMRILEFGCGTGASAVHHSSAVQHVDAIDISENMIAIGRDRAEAAGANNISFTRSTLADFNARAESYDAVLSLNVLHLLPDREAVIAEVVRILKPGGVFVSSTACLGLSYLRFIKLLAPLGKLLGLMPDVFIMSEDQLTDEIVDSGLEIERQWHHGKQNIAVFIIARKPR